MHCFSYGFTEDFYDNRTAVPRRWIATKPPFVITPIVSKNQGLQMVPYACVCLCRMLCYFDANQ